MARIHNILDFSSKKSSGTKISIVTCYDYSSALIVAASDIDCVLVGDSVAMTMHGASSTISATIEQMVMHTEWVVRGLKDGTKAGEKPPFVIGDLPFLSYRKDLTANIEAALAIMQAGANAIKLEGAKGNLALIEHLVDSGVPIMGHLGLTPQSVNQIGGYKVQGKTTAAHDAMLDDAKALAAAGCFAMVLECVPAALAKEISEQVQIVTIGIGAGNDTDGQVLVWQDLLGLNTQFKPKFVRRYFDGFGEFQKALNHYHADVLGQNFPSDAESFK
ncbi:MAG: 3-methyl-2-oxobutanoate hydroxymethyltransferase [Hyphomonadaceae bacterium]|nr:MAG: 3-methyl-2-oxobutanoate hydroxymethyltransferase [Hyphomonadaceae bacterium]KAF0183461.1 MAG: 3-methyl-2-oxobutanoate hydroxymethyltransferase [Hyphomonadaceae bacterium]